tara:strand:+ start:2134 stop:2544 length:411 start_codon:yes stop_codon:yes gene_type:complete
MIKKKEKSLNASCLCKGVNMKIRGEFRPVINCHCIQCTKTHGNFASYTSILEENIVFKSKKTLKWFKSSDKASRGFCKNCGASIFFKRSGSRAISISAGLLKNPTGLQTISHIFIHNKRDYYKLSDKLPKFKKYYK